MQLTDNWQAMQRVMNSAARIVSIWYSTQVGCTTTRHIQAMHDRLQVSARNGPIYLSEMCRPSSSEAGRRHLRSAKRSQLVVPRYRLTTAGRRAFSCTRPSAWNSLPEYLTVDTLTLDYFKCSLKCYLFARYWHSAWSTPLHTYAY